MKRLKNALTCSLVLVGLIAAVGLLSALGYLAYYRFLPPLIIGRRDAARPTVTIFAPQHGNQVATRATVVVQAEGTARGSQVVLIQLWADGALIGEQNGAAERLNASWSWLPLIPGDHTLAVRAYNARRDAGVAMVRVTAIEAADADRDGVPDAADTCPDRAGLLQLDGCPPGMTGGTSSGNPEAQEVADAWVAPGGQEQPGSGPAGEQPGPRPGEGEGDPDGDGVADANDQCPDQPGPPENQGCPREVSGGGPGTIQGNQQRPRFEDSDFPPGQIAIERNCAICEWLERQGREYRDTEVTPGVGLEVEVLSLRTAGGLSDVACYARLPNPQWEQWGRVPEGQNEFFAPLGDGSWKIADYLGGEHGVVVTVPEGEALRMDVRCYGRLGDMLTPSLHLGEVTREHGPADWNGQTFTARGQEGGNWFDIQYRICGVPCEEVVIPPPYDLRVIRNEGVVTSYVLSWRWDGDPAMIDGFHIYRDGNRIATAPGADQRFTILSQSMAEPECSDEYRFEVRAYKGTQESAPSSPAFSVSRFSCGGRNELELADVILPTPQRAVLYVALNYWYDGNHGDQVHVFVLPLQEGNPPGWPNLFHVNFSLVTDVIEPGHGTVSYLAVYYGGSEPMVTDGLRLVMMDENEPPDQIYTRDVPLAVQWYPSGPDLAWGGINIFSPPRQEEGQTVYDFYFRVANRGFARLLWKPDLHIRAADGTILLSMSHEGFQQCMDQCWREGLPSCDLRCPYYDIPDWGDVWLPPGGSTVLVWPRPPIGRLAPNYEVVLDPNNVIAELNEGNNTIRGAVRSFRVTFEYIYAPHGEEVRYRINPLRTNSAPYYVGLNGLLQVSFESGGGFILADRLMFRGGAADDWVDNWGENDLFECHEEGLMISNDAGASVDELLNAFSQCYMSYTLDHAGPPAHIGYGPWIFRTGTVPPSGYMSEHDRNEWCQHLYAQGYAPTSNYLDVAVPPDRALRIDVYLSELDNSYDWAQFGCTASDDHICTISREVSPEELQSLPLHLELHSWDGGCTVNVTIEELMNP